MPWQPGGGGGLPSAGEVVADDGEIYATVQEAIDASTDYAVVGPGEFDEEVTVGTVGFSLTGVGRSSVIAPTRQAGDVRAINVAAEDVTVSNLATRSDSLMSNYTIDAAGFTSTVRDVVVLDGDDGGVKVGADSLVTGCRFEGSISWAVDIVGPDCIVADSVATGITNGFGIEHSRGSIIGCTVTNVNNVGIAVYTGQGTGDSIVMGNTVDSPNSNGIELYSNDSLAGGNRVMNAGDKGIVANATNQIIFNNRVSGSLNADIDTASATTPTLDGNLTG